MWAYASWIIGAVGLTDLALSIAVLFGRRRLFAVTVALGAVVFLAGWVGLFWGIVHGLHSVHLSDAIARRNGVMVGVAAGVNAIQAALLCTLAVATVLFIDTVRVSRRRGVPET